jgi:hypothetical protein
MNYPLAWLLLGYFGAATVLRELKLAPLPEPPYQPLDRPAFQQRVERELGRYSEAVSRCQLNLLDSHDTPRALHALGGDIDALRLALLFLFLLPGAPCVYYGTEMGLDGGPEPGCREAFPWDRGTGELQGWLRELAALRRRLPALRSIPLTFANSEHDDLLLLWRGSGMDRLWVAINRGDAALPLKPPASHGRLLWTSIGNGEGGTGSPARAPAGAVGSHPGHSGTLRRRAMAPSKSPLTPDDLLEDLAGSDDLLIVQDLDGVCMELVHDPRQRRLDPDYVQPPAGWTGVSRCSPTANMKAAAV